MKKRKALVLEDDPIRTDQSQHVLPLKKSKPTTFLITKEFGEKLATVFKLLTFLFCQIRVKPEHCEQTIRLQAPQLLQQFQQAPTSEKIIEIQIQSLIQQQQKETELNYNFELLRLMIQIDPDSFELFRHSISISMNHDLKEDLELWCIRPKYQNMSLAAKHFAKQVKLHISKEITLQDLPTRVEETTAVQRSKNTNIIETVEATSQEAVDTTSSIILDTVQYETNVDILLSNVFQTHHFSKEFLEKIKQNELFKVKSKLITKELALLKQLQDATYGIDLISSIMVFERKTAMRVSTLIEKMRERSNTAHFFSKLNGSNSSGGDVETMHGQHIDEPFCKLLNILLQKAPQWCSVFIPSHQETPSASSTPTRTQSDGRLVEINSSLVRQNQRITFKIANNREVLDQVKKYLQIELKKFSEDLKQNIEDVVMQRKKLL